MISNTSPNHEWTQTSSPVPNAGDSLSIGLHNCIAHSQFDAARDLAWGELVRDVAALANSGGGYVVVSLEGDARLDSEKIVAGILERLAPYNGLPV